MKKYLHSLSSLFMMSMMATVSLLPLVHRRVTRGRAIASILKTNKIISRSWWLLITAFQST